MSVAQLPIHSLGISTAFESLSLKEKHYAHHMARAAWYGARIILRQVSPESIGIFEFILELYRSCSGDWNVLVTEGCISQEDCSAFLDYAATFMSNVGNYYGSGDQKFVPSVSPAALAKLSTKSPKLENLYGQISNAITTLPPYGLGYPGDKTQSAYYPGDSSITESEIAAVSRLLEENSIFPENTRIQKVSSREAHTFEVLQASVEQDADSVVFELPAFDATIKVKRGDHFEELAKICSSLSQAKKYAANEKQDLFLSEYIDSFITGDLGAYRSSQRTWITDKSPRVENIFGFVEPYRDPYGSRAEFEGLVAITDPEETNMLGKLVQNSSIFIKRLPWAGGEENNGKGPFEKALFEPPDFTSIHSLAYCSSIIFPGINLPNYNDIRDECGFKNVIIANRMSAEGNKAYRSPFVDPTELEDFHKAKYPAYYWWVVLHELLGHGTGRMMVEDSQGKFNFDIDNPPINPLSGKPITTWYRPGQTWTGQFGDLATTVDECRAELVGAYLMDDIDLLQLLGHDEFSEITAAELTYNTYMQLGTDGLRGLANFNAEHGKWGQAHSRAHFAILKCLLTDSDGCVTVDHDAQSKNLIVRVDRSKIVSHGKPALGRMLLRLHTYRCTADVQSCREYYEDLSRVHAQYLVWREIVLAKQEPKWVFVQANTFLHNEEVILKEYPTTAEGVVQSWAERQV
ncbi:peptidase M49, dipeptidyl-peptidase III [Dothidotthia symphoricarpi CBS 119687]|uniref:Dipeptidyl peptidase 3 n=1 Tax=Dothidotthia symphoricarpi CBS 119687 TaxID=1392245 RepID=A0A6A5ZZC7_9PLEO|nr:peptidase M49, dipeptidyl-peptidase III [Dothidotthia symphoricarpi CBS 119687]KAF2124107.1 peptidase M49, dipeptidyl-peptidase III [Dothidotthia symphoricarpi CBS 119687]